jgi:GNAT superfamily N-acetyltransferase
MEKQIFTGPPPASPTSSPELTFREATPDDGPRLQALQALIEHGGAVRTRKINAPDFFGRYRAFDRYKVFVACAGDRIVASDAFAIRPATIAGELRRIGHVSHTFVSPEIQASGIGSRFKREFGEPYLRSHGVALMYGHVAEGNERALRSVRRAGWDVARRVSFTGLPIYRSMPTRPGVTIRPFRPEDAGEVAALSNRTWGRHELHAPCSPDDLPRSLARTYGDRPEAIQVLEARGRIVACVGVWDWSAVEQITVLGLTPRLRALAPALDLVRRFRPAPRIPSAGEVLRQWFCAPLGFEDPADVGEVVRRLNNRAHHEGVEQIFLMSERGAPVLRAVDGFFKVSMHMQLVVKPLEAGVRLGDGPLYVPATDA